MEYKEASAIIKELKTGNFKPVYILHGLELYFIDLVVNYIEKHVLSEAEKAFNLSVLYGKDVGFKQVLDHARQYPMMASHRVVILKEAKAMRELKLLGPYLDNPSPQTILVIAHPSGKIHGGLAWMKHAKKSSDFALFLSDPIREYNLEKWVLSYLSQKGRKIDRNAVQLLCQYLGTDLQKMVNEIDKIEINISIDDTITVHHIDQYVGISKDFNVFELLKQIGSKNHPTTQMIVANMRANPKREPLPMILPQFTSYFQKLMIISQHPRTSENDLSRMIRAPYMVVKEYKHALQYYSIPKMARIFRWIKDADAQSKGVGNRSSNDGDILQELVGKIMAI